jgi:hypothetical protein
MHFYRDEVDGGFGFHTMRLDDYSSRVAAVIVRSDAARRRAAEHMTDGWHFWQMPGYPVVLIATRVLALPARCGER